MYLKRALSRKDNIRLQLEVENTVALHLRSRRVGSDEAVYQVIDLFSRLLARLSEMDSTTPQRQGAPSMLEQKLQGFEAERHARLEQHIEDAIAVLQGASVRKLVSDLTEITCPWVTFHLALFCMYFCSPMSHDGACVDPLCVTH
jgi:hypothetical protein